MLIDTHAHLNFKAFEKDLDEVIKKSLSQDVRIINVGTDLKTSKRAIEIAEKYPEGIFASIGLHPINLETGLMKLKKDSSEGVELESDFDFEKYGELASSKKVIAIGEIGLDFYYKPKTTKKKEIFKEKQKELLFKELTLAKKLNLPAIFHCRIANNDLIDLLLKNPDLRPKKAVIHGFVGNLEQLEKYLDFGYYIGFNGIIFKEIEDIDFSENIKRVPLEKIVLETDCPYLIPPSRKETRNEPIFVEDICKEVAKIKNVSFEELAEITTKNAKEIFQIL